MMWSALAEAIIPVLNILRKAVMSSYFPIFLAIFSSYFFSKAFALGTSLSYFSLPVSCLTIVLGNTLAEQGQQNGFDACSQLVDSIEELCGNGPKVAAYLRVSTSRQAKEGFSLEAQRDAINKLKSELNPSKIYWFIDAGKSSKSPEDFDKLKIRSISKLRERKEIQELWVFKVNRIGRVCRKLLYFYLDFCDDGGIIRDTEKKYDMKELGSVITFVLEAHAAEKANKDRAAAAVSGKARAFKQKRWNKPEPLGYQKAGWLQKCPEFEPLIKEVYHIFLTEGHLESVRNRLGNFTRLLAKPLTCSQIRRVLSDPVYMGRPEHLGEIVIDSDLAFIDEATFQQSLQILVKIKEGRKPKRILQKLAIEKPIIFSQVLTEFELHHRDCGGLVWMNGPTDDEGQWQQLFQCKKCKTFWRLPHIKPDKNKPQEGVVGKNFMGGLSFDKLHSQSSKRHDAKNGLNGSVHSTSQRLLLSEHS